MTPGDLLGATFGPTRVAVTADRVSELVSATGDDPGRWVDAAPPGFAAVLLFAVAGDFLWDDRIADHTRTLLHLDQEFVYLQPIAVGADVEVAGTVTRVRERSGAHFVTFEAAASHRGEALLTSTSTFLMSARPAGDAGPDEAEPAADAKAIDERAASGRVGTPLMKSASRRDLIRYAAATKDFNPIHWDHDAARIGGAPGIIVHGLLMFAWTLQAAAAGDGAHIDAAKVRFRSPLRPGEQAVVTASVVDQTIEEAATAVSMAVLRDDRELASGIATVRLDRG